MLVGLAREGLNLGKPWSGQKIIYRLQAIINDPEIRVSKISHAIDGLLWASTRKSQEDAI